MSQKEERQRILEKIPEGDEKEGAAASGDAKTRKRKKKPHGKIGFENLAKVCTYFPFLLFGGIHSSFMFWPDPHVYISFQ